MRRSLNFTLLNLLPKQTELPCGCMGSSKSGYSWFYRDDQLEIVDPALPSAYLYHDRPPVLKTIRELRQVHLQLKPNVQPRGCFRHWDGGHSYGNWEMLYHLDDCEPGERLQYITKGRLKDVYQLSDSWLKRLGGPDFEVDNPHFRRSAPMQLYMRGRVEDFLAAHADEYADWLTKRDRYIELAKANQEQIKARRHQKMEEQERITHQTQMCCRCASGVVTDCGFLCAIHPNGWAADVPQEHFCPDWTKRTYA